MRAQFTHVRNMCAHFIWCDFIFRIFLDFCVIVGIPQFLRVIFLVEVQGPYPWWCAIKVRSITYQNTFEIIWWLFLCCDAGSEGGHNQLSSNSNEDDSPTPDSSAAIKSAKRSVKDKTRHGGFTSEFGGLFMKSSRLEWSICRTWHFEKSFCKGDPFCNGSFLHLLNVLGLI